MRDSPPYPLPDVPLSVFSTICQMPNWKTTKQARQIADPKYSSHSNRKLVVRRQDTAYNQKKTNRYGGQTGSRTARRTGPRPCPPLFQSSQLEPLAQHPKSPATHIAHHQHKHAHRARQPPQQQSFLAQAHRLRSPRAARPSWLPAVSRIR